MSDCEIAPGGLVTAKLTSPTTALIKGRRLPLAVAGAPAADVRVAAESGPSAPDFGVSDATTLS